MGPITAPAIQALEAILLVELVPAGVVWPPDTIDRVVVLTTTMVVLGVVMLGVVVLRARLRYKVNADQFSAQKICIAEGPPIGEVSYIVLLTHE
jgi:hypothetical protein